MERIYGVNNKGVTFIELIVVIALLGIVLSISFPKILKNDIEMKLCGKNICNDIRFIRYHKMTEGKQYRIIINEKYYKVLEGTKVIKTVNLNSNLKIVHNFNRNEIRFTYKGSPSFGGGTVNIVNTNNNNFIKVTIVPCTGRIQFIEKMNKGFSKSL